MHDCTSWLSYSAIVLPVSLYSMNILFWSLRVQRGGKKRWKVFPKIAGDPFRQGCCKRLKAEREVFVGFHLSVLVLEKPLTQDSSIRQSHNCFRACHVCCVTLTQMSAAPTTITAHLPEPNISVTLLMSTCQPRSLPLEMFWSVVIRILVNLDIAIAMKFALDVDLN